MLRRLGDGTDGREGMPQHGCTDEATTTTQAATGLNTEAANPPVRIHTDNEQIRNKKSVRVGQCAFAH